MRIVIFRLAFVGDRQLLPGMTYDDVPEGDCKALINRGYAAYFLNASQSMTQRANKSE